jgi:hypothetical protein
MDLFKPFSYLNDTGSLESPSSDGNATIQRHTIPSITWVNHQIRCETLSLYVQESLFVGLESTICIAALQKFAAINYALVDNLHKLHLGVRTRVSPKRSPSINEDAENTEFAGDLAPLAVKDPQAWTEEEGLAYATHQTKLWINTSRKIPDKPWIIDDYMADGMATFQLRITDKGLGFEIHTPFVLKQASLIHDWIEKKLKGSICFDGQTLIRVAAWVRKQEMWELEADKEIVFYQREGWNGRLQEYYRPKKAFRFVIASITAV